MESIKGLVPFVRQAGEIAAERQRFVTRSYKPDGSVLTQVDQDLDRFLHDSIVSLFPNTNVITEENTGELDPDFEFTFTVDPIDGTDCYSQGMPGWSISVGLLDHSFEPVAGIVFIPRWGPDIAGGTLLFADIGKAALLGDQELPPIDPIRHHPELVQIMVGSSIHQRFDMRSFSGKIRNAGSTVTHIVSPLLHAAVVGTILSPNYIWDVAGAHAVIKSKGLKMEYFSGKPLDYRLLAKRHRAQEFIVAGTEEGLDLIRSHFLPVRD